MANSSMIADKSHRAVHPSTPAATSQQYVNGNVKPTQLNGDVSNAFTDPNIYEDHHRQKKVHAFRQLAPPTCDLAVTSCDFAGKTLALARAYNVIEFWLLSHDAPFFLGRVTLPTNLYPKSSCIKFYNKRRLFVSGGASGFLLELSPVRSVVTRAVQCHTGSITAMAVCSKAGKVVVGSETGAISIFSTISTDSNPPEEDLRFDQLLVQLSQPVTCLTIRDQLVAAGGKGKIWIWFLPNGEKNSAVHLLHEINASTAGESRSTILSIAFADENTIVTGDSKGGTCFWDVGTGVLRNGVYAHSEAVTCVQPMQFSSGDGRITEPSVFSSGVHPFLVEFRRAHASSILDADPTSGDGSLSAKWVRTLKLKSVQTRQVRCLTQANEYLVAAGEGATVTLSNSKLLVKIQPLTSPQSVHFAFNTNRSLSPTTASGVLPQYCYIMGCDSEVFNIWRFRTLLSTTTTTLPSDHYADETGSSAAAVTHSELLVVPPEDDSSMSNSSYTTYTSTSHSPSNSTTSNTIFTTSSSFANGHRHSRHHHDRQEKNSTLTCDKLLEYKIRSKNGPLTSSALSDDAAFVGFADCKQLKVFRFNVIDENSSQTLTDDDEEIFALPKKLKPVNSSGNGGPEVYLTAVELEQATAKRLAGSTAMCFVARSTKNDTSGLIVAEKTGSIVWLRLRPNPVDAETLNGRIIWSSANRKTEEQETDDSDAVNLSISANQLAGIRQISIANDRNFIAALTYENRLLVFEFNASKPNGKVVELNRWEKKQKADPFVTFCLTNSTSNLSHFAFLACASQQISMLDLRTRNLMLFFAAALYDGLYDYISSSTEFSTKRRNDRFSCIRHIDCRNGKRLAWSTSEKVYMVDVDWRAIARRAKKRVVVEEREQTDAEPTDAEEDEERQKENLWTNVQVVDSYKHVVSFQELAVPSTMSNSLLTNGHDAESGSACQFVLVEQAPSDIEAHLPSAYRLKKFGF